MEIWNNRALELFSYPIPISCCLSQRGLAINLVSQNEPLFYNFENNYNYFIIYLLCNPDISHLITYSTLSGNCDSTSFFRRRSKKGLKTLCKRRIIKIVSSSFNSTFSPWKNINQIKASLLFNNLYSQIIQKQFRNWIWIIGTTFRVFRPSFRVWDHSFKTSDNFHDFWPLHPYHRHSS